MVELTQVVLAEPLQAQFQIRKSSVNLVTRRVTSFYAMLQLMCGRFVWRCRPAMALCNRAPRLIHVYINYCEVNVT